MDQARNKLTNREIQSAFDAAAGEKYPPIMKIEQVAEMFQLSPSTIYHWCSEGTLDFAKNQRGRHPRFWRDRLTKWFFGERGN